MNLSTFKKIIKQLPDLKKVDLVGIGEPLLNSHLPSLIHYLTNKGIESEIYSNGTLFKQRLEACMNAGLKYLNISIDSANPKVFEKYRRGAKFQAVCDNIAYAVALKKQKKLQTTISFNVMVSRENWKEMPKLVVLAHTLGVKNINIDPIHDWGGAKKNHNTISFFGIDKKHALTIAKQACSLAEKHSVNVTIPPLHRIGCENCFDDFFCIWPWNTASIKINGDVSACTITENKKMIFGNVFNQPFLEIWSSDAYEKFRNSFFTRKRYPNCKRCQMLLSWGLNRSKLEELKNYNNNL